MDEPDTERDLTSGEILESLSAVGRAVARFSTPGKGIRVNVVSDGLWLEGYDGAAVRAAALISLRDLARTPGYLLALEVEKMAREL